MTAGLIVICGATATGKSGLALALAQRMPTVILSADSRQVYREFTIGTAKPTQEQRQQVPHYFIDTCNPTETYTAGEYQDQATSLITQLHRERVVLPCLVGGTGLYIKAIVRGMTMPGVAAQPSLRQSLIDLGQRQCYAMLSQVDPQATKRIHAHDQVRTIRALEVFYVTGKPITALQAEHPPGYPILQIGLDSSSDLLHQRIEHRTRQMIERGLVTEVARLCDRYGPDLPLLGTLGYREIAAYLTGQWSLAAAEAAIVQHTRQFAKRQRTWFRADPTIEWFNADAPDVLDRVWQRLCQWQLETSGQLAVN